MASRQPHPFQSSLDNFPLTYLNVSFAINKSVLSHFIVCIFFKYNIKHRGDCFYRIKQTISEGITQRPSMSPYSHIDLLVSLLKPRKPRHDQIRLNHDQIISTRHICSNGADVMVPELCNQRRKGKISIESVCLLAAQSRHNIVATPQINMDETHLGLQ